MRKGKLMGKILGIAVMSLVTSLVLGIIENYTVKVRK